MKLRNYVQNLLTGIGQNAVPVSLRRMAGDGEIDTTATIGTDEAGQYEFALNGSPGRAYTLIENGGQSRRVYTDVSMGRWGGWTDAEFYEFFGTFGNGVVADIGDELPVTAGTGLQLLVGTGLFLIDCSPYRVYEAEPLTVTANSSGVDRVDMVVIRKTRTGDDMWKTVAAIVTGSTTLTQTAATWEEEIARLTIPNGASSITGAMLSDQRVYLDVQGVTGADAGATTTKTIAAADSTTLAKAIADIVCDGVNDQVDLETALGAGNVRAYLFNGTYEFDDAADLPPGFSVSGESVDGVVINVNSTAGAVRSGAAATMHTGTLEHFTVLAGADNTLGLDLRGISYTMIYRVLVEGFDRGIHFGGDSATYTGGSSGNTFRGQLADCLVSIYCDGAAANVTYLEDATVTLRNDLSGIGCDLVAGALHLLRTEIVGAFNAYGVVQRAAAGNLRIESSFFNYASQSGSRYPIQLEAGAVGQYFAGNRYSSGCTKPHINDLNGDAGRYVQLDANATSLTHPDGYVELNTDVVFSRSPSYPNGLEIEIPLGEAFALNNGSGDTMLGYTQIDGKLRITLANAGFVLEATSGGTEVLDVNSIRTSFQQRVDATGTNGMFSVRNDDGSVEYLRASSVDGLQLAQGGDLTLYSTTLGGTVAGFFETDGDLWAAKTIKSESLENRALTSQRGPDTDDLVFAVDNLNERLLLHNGAGFEMYSDAGVSRVFQIDGADGDFSNAGNADLGTNYQNKHLIRGQLTIASNLPTVSVGAAAGTGASLTRTGTDSAGRLVLTTGTSPTTGLLATVTFASARSSGDYIVLLGAADSDAANTGLPRIYSDFSANSASKFELHAATALAASTSYHLFFFVLGTA